MAAPEAILVVPCFNEAARLADEAFLAFTRQEPGVHFLMVDDGSRDATLERLVELEGRAQGSISTLALARNRGKAEAVRQGVLKALEERPSVVGYWDADLATPLDAIPELLAVLRQNPAIRMALGSRVKLIGRHIERSAARHYLGRVFATAASITLGLEIYDTQCGAKLLRVDRDTLALFAEPFVTNWTFDVELIARLAAICPERSAEAVLYELPLRAWRDVPGSNVRPVDFVRGLVELTRIGRRYRTRRLRAPRARA